MSRYYTTGWFCTSTVPGLVAVGAVDLAIWPVCYTHRIQKSRQIFASLCMRLIVIITILFIIAILLIITILVIIIILVIITILVLI
jgi:hypothetical protein